MNGARTLRAVGMAGKNGSRHIARRTRQLQANSQRILRPAQASNKRPQMTGLAAKTAAAADDVGLPPCRWVGGVRWYSERRAQTYLTCPYPTYRLCLSLSLPTPLICQKKNPIWPQINFFCYFFTFNPYFPTIISSPNPFNVLVRLTYLSPTLLPTPTFPSQREIGRVSVLCRGPMQASRWPPRNSAVTNSEWVQRPTTRAKGWMVRRGTLPN